MSISKAVIGVVMSSLLSVQLWAQQGNTCEEQLNAATVEFESGRFYSIASMLKPCLDKGFTNEQRKRAYLLLTQTYLLLDDPIGADNSYLEVLRADPEFEADTARDQIEVVYLSKRFTAAPQFSIFGRLGANTAFVRTIQTINASGERGVENSYKQRIGFQGGLGVDWHINERIAVTGEVNYVATSYQKNQVKFENDVEEFTDRQNWISIPVGLKYTILTRAKYRPYVFGGYALNILISDKGQIDISKRDIGEGALDESSPTINFNDYRRKFNTAVFFGGGVRYKVGLNFVFAEARYTAGLTNIVKSTSTYNTDGPAVQYGHVDDYFRLDNLSISVGFIRPLYNPRKVKRAKTKTVLKGIKKQAK